MPDHRIEKFAPNGRDKMPPFLIFKVNFSVSIEKPLRYPSPDSDRSSVIPRVVGYRADPTFIRNLVSNLLLPSFAHD